MQAYDEWDSSAADLEIRCLGMRPIPFDFTAILTVHRVWCTMALLVSM